VRALCLLLLIGACNRVWGFDRPDAALDATDAENDADVPVSITSLTIAGEIATGETQRAVQVRGTGCILARRR
jgi:hypothetical protein